MWKQALVLGLTAAVLSGLPSPLRSEEGCGCSPFETKQWTFDSKQALAGWTVSGDVGFDNTKSRAGQPGGMRIGPGGKALIKLRDKDASGKFEPWVYDDGTMPENAKAARVGPRWGLVQNDRGAGGGHPLHSYLGGSKATPPRQRRQDLVRPFVLAGREPRPPGWHKWTFDFDAEEGLQVSHNGQELPRSIRPRLA